MRPVNLLPERYRPAKSSGKRSGSAYVALGVLGALLLAVFLIVHTSNQVADRKEQTAAAETEAQQAEAQTGTLAAYGDFKEAKETRTQSVGSIANGRFDWERFMRELARVLPAEVSLSGAEASVSGDGEAAPDPAAAPAGPTAKLTGCAVSHPDVATLMVRLRQMDRVTDVKLTESAKGSDGAGSGQPAEGGAGGGGCGTLVTFDVTVIFDPAPPAPQVGGVAGVPASLGGGQ